MAHFDITGARRLLQELRFEDLFVEALGWNAPHGARPTTLPVDGAAVTLRQIAELGGVVVFEVTTAAGAIPDAAARAAIHAKVSDLYHENLLVFLDADRTQTVWYWVKREAGKRYGRSHTFVKGQTGDLFLSKIARMFVDMSELDDQGNLPVVEVARRLRDSLDVERVTKRFYDEFNQIQALFTDRIAGIDDPRDRRWYTSVILNRLMFITFLQRKGFIDGGDVAYLRNRLAASKRRGADRFYRETLRLLFFEGFARPQADRSPEARALLGDVVYLNGGLFLPHTVETRYPDIAIPDDAFEALFDLFDRYSWSLDDTPGGHDDEINPAVLGYIFEKVINQKAFGAYYTRPEITEYLCEKTIDTLILDRVAELTTPVPGMPAPGRRAPRRFESIGDLLLDLDASTCSLLLHEILPRLSLLDPACGSGAFLVAAMKALERIYEGVLARIPFLKDAALRQWYDRVQRDHPSLGYFVKKRIITQNLFGVDIMPEAVEIARLRLFLALVSAAQSVHDLEPLPNIDFNILAGNSLIGLLRVDDTTYQVRLGEESYTTLVARKNAMVQAYRNAAESPELKGNAAAIGALRDEIERQRRATNRTLDGVLLDRFRDLGIRFEQETWDARAGAPGKPVKRALTADDIAALQPFHWGYEFDEVMNERGGFDAIITNPPWEAVKPQDKEFLADYSDAVTKKTMSKAELDAELRRMVKDPEILKAYLAYLSGFRHQSAYFRAAPQYEHQRAKVDGRWTGSDVNLYKLFTEQCFRLLRDGGEAGLVIASGIYTDLGATGLREMLFAENEITGLFGFENRKGIFEGVDSRFKFVVLTFRKGGRTVRFPAAFMRQEVEELAHFPAEGALMLSVDLIQRLSPGSCSLMEFDSALDVRIAEKMLRFPTLGEALEGTWNLQLSNEFHMTNDAGLFREAPGPGRLPLYEGKMIHQFTHTWGAPRYWVDEKEGRGRLLGRDADVGQTLDYQTTRLGFRDIARNTDTRTMIATVIPPAFHGNKLPTVRVFDDTGQPLLDPATQLYLCAVWNSFVLDWVVRLKVTTTLNFFYVYQLPIPRLTPADPAFAPIVDRAARLICTASEYDALAAAVGLGDHTHGVTDPEGRARLRAELDGMVAHLYGLTEEEFRHVLGTFPLVEEAVKDAALAAYREMAEDPAVVSLILGGESATVEFKVGLCRNPHTGQPDKSGMRKPVIEAVAGFMNAAGGTVLLGVRKDGVVEGVENEYGIADSGWANWDGYMLYLQNVLNAALQIDAPFRFTSVTQHTVSGHTVCRIAVQPADEPVYVDKHFYVRIGNQTKELLGPDLVAYLASHWPGK